MLRRRPNPRGPGEGENRDRYRRNRDTAAKNRDLSPRRPLHPAGRLPVAAARRHARQPVALDGARAPRCWLAAGPASCLAGRPKVAFTERAEEPHAVSRARSRAPEPPARQVEPPAAGTLAPPGPRPPGPAPAPPHPLTGCIPRVPAVRSTLLRARETEDAAVPPRRRSVSFRPRDERSSGNARGCAPSPGVGTLHRHRVVLEP